MRDATAPGWSERAQPLAALAERQLFFVGGAPRSGTTWLQHLLDSHPEVCCAGEGLFLKHLAEPLQALVAGRRQALQAKNTSVFRDFGGYPLPDDSDAEHLAGTAILLALQRQCAGRTVRAVGEKTPENVFFFPHLKRLFPAAKFIGIARDPRDVLTSAWHFFRPDDAAHDDARAMARFIRAALPSLQQGAQAMLALAQLYPTDCMIVTYERLLAAPDAVVAELFGFLGVSCAADVIAACVARTRFAAMSASDRDARAGGRAFLRRGIAGDWRATLPPDCAVLIVQELGWSFSKFGWTP